MIRNERYILNVVTSKVASIPAGGMGALKAPQRGTGRSPGEKIVSKMKKKYNPPVDHQVSPHANVLGLRAIFRKFRRSDLAILIMSRSRNMLNCVKISSTWDISCMHIILICVRFTAMREISFRVSVRVDRNA